MWEGLSGDAASQPWENVGGIWLGSLLNASVVKYSRDVRLGGDSDGDQRHVGQTVCLYWPGNALGFHRRNWPKCLGRGNSGPLCLGCCPDGRMDRQLRNELSLRTASKLIYISIVCVLVYKKESDITMTTLIDIHWWSISENVLSHCAWNTKRWAPKWKAVMREKKQDGNRQEKDKDGKRKIKLFHF